MKKIMTLVLACCLITAISCKKEKPKTDATAEESMKNTIVNRSCMDEIANLLAKDPNSLNSIDAAKTLKNCGKVVCDGELYDSIVAFHRMDTTEYKKALKRFWKNTASIQYSHKIDIDSLLNALPDICYEKYLTSNMNTNQDMKEFKLQTIDDYTLTQPCFSLPLFKSIKKKYGAAKVKFTKIGDPSAPRMAFEILDKKNTTISGGYYDFTDRPLDENPVYKTVKLIQEQL